MSRTLTLRQRIYLWEHAEEQGLSKVCNICHKPILTFEDMELDHIRAYSKGGSTLALVHRTCNKLKSSGSLKEIQTRLGIKDEAAEARKTELGRLLKKLKIKQLKELCDELGIERPKSRDAGNFITVMEAPSKSAYIRRIIKSDVDTEKIKGFVSKYG
jgi:hypothetical protein